MEEINLALLVEDLSTKIQEKNPRATIRYIQKGAIPLTIGDKPGLTSVILNLLENAVKYSADQPIIEARIWSVQEQIHLEIADHGIGISDKEKKNIFEKFYRVGSENTRKTKGTGLGLYIVKEIVKTHDGDIQVLDNQPKGTIFKITLPIKAVEKFENALVKEKT